MADYIITNADFRAAITAAGFTGITLDATAYPDVQSCNKAVKDFLDALEAAQTTQNAAAAAGADVSVITTGVGTPANVEYPPNSGTFYVAQPVARSVTYQQVQTVSDFIPVVV